MIFSEQINEISKALANVQKVLKHASKDSKNPYFKSNYADLGEVWRTCQPLLAENGLAIIQLLEVIDGKQALITILSHISGQWIKGTALLPISKPGAQEIGSCITYFRRYCLAAMVGVYQDDDDAEASEKPYREEQKNRLTDKQCEQLERALLEIDNDEYVNKLEDLLGVMDIFQMLPKDFPRVMASVNKKLQEVRNGSIVA